MAARARMQGLPCHGPCPVCCPKQSRSRRSRGREGVGDQATEHSEGVGGGELCPRCPEEAFKRQLQARRNPGAGE